MLTVTDENIKSITILIKEKDLQTVKTILNFLKEKFSGFSVMKFKTGVIGEDLLVSFKVASEYYQSVLEKFAYNDIPVIMKDKGALQFIDQKKEQKRKKLRAQGWSEITKSKRQITIAELTQLVEDGKVKEVLKEAKGGVGSNLEIVKKSKELLKATVKNAITNLVIYSEERIGKRGDAIDQLLLLATDKDLKLFHKEEDMSDAGLKAIEIASSHKNYYDYFIKICNNSKLNNLVNIKAAISLANIFKNNNEENKMKLPNVIKLLNTRWLKIAFETAKQKLTDEEINLFNNFITEIEEIREAA